MSFGQKILEKFGHKPGQGLGKHGSGIVDPIKVNYKFDNAGLGDNGPVKEDHWWERVYSEASNNVNVKKSENGKIAMEMTDKDGVEITNKSFSLKKLKNSNTKLQYGSFLKSATLLANVGQEEEVAGHLTTTEIEFKPHSVMSDEDLFKACGGRTAHKGARHGLKLTGKLKRIEEQEKLLLEKMKGRKEKHEVFREPFEVRKQQKRPLVDLNSSKDDTSDDNRLPIDTESDYILKASKKRKKKDKKEELQLVTKINSIGLSSDALKDLEEPTEHEEEDEPRVATPIRKKKTPKRASDALLSSILEVEDSAGEKKKKKKKGKRKLDDEDEGMPEECREKYLKEVPPAVKPKKVKLNDSYEASDDDEDLVEKINAEQEARKSKKSKKKSKKSKQKSKKRTEEVAENIANSL